MMKMRTNSFTGVRSGVAGSRPAPVLTAAKSSSKRTSIVSRFSLGGIATAAISFLAHPSRAVAEAIYQQPITGAVDSGLDLSATLSVVAGGVAGYLGFQLKKQLDKSSKAAGEVLHLSKLRDALEDKLKASRLEVAGLKAAITKAFSDLRDKEVEAMERGSLMVAMQQQLVQMKSQLYTADSLIAALELRATSSDQADSAAAAEAAKLRKVVASLNADKAELLAAVQAAQALAQDESRARKVAEARCQAVQTELAAANSKVVQLEDHISELRRSVTSLQQQMDVEVTAAVAAIAEAKTLAAEKTNLGVQLANTNARVSQFESAITALTADASATQAHTVNQMQLLKGEAAQLQSAKASIELELKKLQTVYASAMANAAHLETKLAGTMQQLSGQQDALAQAASSLEEALLYRQEAVTSAAAAEQYRREVQAVQQEVATLRAAAEADQHSLQLAHVALKVAQQKQRELQDLADRQQVLSLPVAAELELLGDTIKPVKAVRASTRARRSAAAVLPEDNQPETSEAATSGGKVAVARSASARSRVVKAKATEGAAGVEVDAAPAKKPRASKKTAIAAGAEAVSVNAPGKPARAARKSKKAAPVAAQEDAAPVLRAQLPWEAKPKGPSTA